MARGVKKGSLVALAALGLTLARCGGPVREPTSSPPPPPAPAPVEPRPAPRSARLSGVKVYVPAAPRDPAPELHSTMAPVILRQCTADDRVVVKALISKSSSAYVEARHGEAIRLSRRALTRCKHDDYMAYQIIGAASCAHEDAATARWAHARIPRDKRGLMEEVCFKAGIELVPTPVMSAPPTPPSGP